jgi:hypothetical protein
MAMKQLTRPVMVVLAGLALGASACAPLDQVVLPTGRNSTLQGEVRSVDTRRGRLEIREDQYARTRTVRIDNRTRVMDGSRQQRVSSLRRGDHVRVRVSYDRNGAAWADRIDVRHSTRSVGARVERVDGRVTTVDHRRGYFAVEQGRRSTVVVHVPRGVSRNDARRFDRLRRGDRVRADIRPVGRDQAELVRFR